MYYANGERRYITGRKGETAKEVSARLRAVLTDLDKGIEAPKDNRLTVGEWLDAWVIEHRKNVQYDSWRRYEEPIRLHIKPFIGKLRLTQLTKLHVKQLYVHCIAKGLAYNTVKKVQNALHKALNDAVDAGLLIINVADRVSIPPATKKKKEKVIFTAEETDRIIAAAKGHKNEAAIVVIALTGCRIGEVLGARWPALNLDKGILEVVTSLKPADRRGWMLGSPKTEESEGTVYLTRYTVEVLRQHHVNQTVKRLKYGAGWNPLNLIFPSATGTPINRNNFRNRDWAETLRKAGVRYSSPHTGGRDSSATQASINGATLQQLKGFMRHRSITTTSDRYVHDQEEASRSVRDNMERLHG
jgi:integrase